MAPSDILLVEDDVKLAELTREFIAHHGFNVRVVSTCHHAKSEFTIARPDLILLDLNLPDGDGLGLCRYFRASFFGPIIMLTARDSNSEELVGFDCGADDYIRKPADPMILLARIQSFLRKNQREKRSSETLRVGALELRAPSQQVFLSGKEVNVTSMEFLLLATLVEHAGEIVSRDELNRRARGIEYDGLDRTVDVRISRLRKKLDDLSEHPNKIRTVRGKGYLLVSDEW